MKSFYDKTSVSTMNSRLFALLRGKMQDYSHITGAVSKRPLLMPALLLISCGFLCFYLESFLPAVVLCVFVMLMAVYSSKTDSRKLRQNNAGAASRVLAAMLLCLVLLYDGAYISKRLNTVETAAVSGQFRCTVTEVSYDLSGGIDMTVKLENGIYAKVNFYKGIPEGVGPGDVLTLHGKLKEPESGGNPGEFDYKKYLKTKGILYVISCERCELKAKSGFPLNVTGCLRRCFFELRKGAVNIVADTFSSEDKALVSAVCTGDRSLISSDVKREFKLSCLSHILAVSGTHFAGFLTGLPVMLDVLKVKRKKALLIYSVFAVLIGCLTGWSDSVTRAAIMSICVFAMRDWLSALCTASMVMAIADPFCPLSTGFQMSFCAVIAIKVYSGKIAGLLNKFHIGKTLAGLISPAVSASLGMMPFWTDISMRPDMEHIALQIAASFIAQAACMFFIPCVILCVILSFWSGYLSSPLLFCIRLLKKTVDTGSVLSLKEGRPVHLSKAFLIVFAIVIFLYLIPPGILKRLLFKPAVLILAVSVGAEVFPMIKKPLCTVIFADVGQGDCCLIITPESTCLIDAGTYDEGASTVSDLLDYYGIYKVDICIMSHWDVDHAGGIAALFVEGRTDTVLTAYLPSPGNEDKDVLEFFKAVGFDQQEKDSYIASLCGVKAGDRIELAEQVSLDVLYPSSAKGGGNEDSLVAMLKIKGNEETDLLFTGDIGMNTESVLVENCSGIDCDILKVAHHGSKYSTSEAFIDACTPEIAVISVGKNIFYGHPAPATLKRLEDYGCEIYRTDTEGAVIIEF